jgi:hypothetical protein
MAKDLRTEPARSPAERVAHEAIELAIEGRSPYPENAMFIDADEPGTGEAIKKAVDEGRAVVLAYADGTTRVLRGEAVSAYSHRALRRPAAGLSRVPAARQGRAFGPRYARP